MVQPPEMRASDADRDRIAGVLRDAHAEGRLTQDELLDRLESTFTARTYRDLDRLVADLPIPRAQGTIARLQQRPLSAPPPPQRPIRKKVRRAARSALSTSWWIWGTVVSINLLIWFIVSITTGSQYFWPIWVAGPWGMVLLAGELAYRRGDRRRDPPRPP
jgi:Domain of unknown function (DUF1707)